MNDISIGNNNHNGHLDNSNVTTVTSMESPDMLDQDERLTAQLPLSSLSSSLVPVEQQRSLHPYQLSVMELSYQHLFVALSPGTIPTVQSVLSRTLLIAMFDEIGLSLLRRKFSEFGTITALFTAAVLVGSRVQG